MRHKINRKPTLKELHDAPFSSNIITGNQAWLSIDGASYYKIADNKWRRYSTNAHTIGGSMINDNDMYEILKRGTNVNMQWD